MLVTLFRPITVEHYILQVLTFCIWYGIFQEVTGIYVNSFCSALNSKNGFPVFATVVEANYVQKKQDLFAAYKLTDEDKADIQKLSKDPRIGQRVQNFFNSF